MTTAASPANVADLLRELAVYVAHDRDAARVRAADPARNLDTYMDRETADALHRRWREIHELADTIETTDPRSIDAGPRTLDLVRALASDLVHQLRRLEPSPAARRASPWRPLPSVTLEAVPTKVVAYLRVSTDRQADEGFGLDIQEAAVREWAKHNRARVAYVARDEGRSGTADAIDRPGLAEALGHVQAGRAQAVVVARLDRLARELVLQEWIRAELLKAGGELRSASTVEDLYLVDDPNDPTGNLVRQILGAVAQYEREMIRLRMQAGKAKKHQAGGYACGQPPYGYKASGHDLVPDLVQQQQIRRMKRWRREGKSYRDIAERLNADQVAPARGAKWHPITVSRVINRAA